MEDFGEWLQSVSIRTEQSDPVEALVVAAAAHTWFVTIHPFIDGNGRVARLLLNLLLMRFGFPIAVITREDRLRYYDALEASQTSDLTPLVDLVCECVEESLEEYEVAAKEQREKEEWAKSLASKFDSKEKTRASNQYEVWRNAMELLKSHFRHTVELIAGSADVGSIFVKDFGVLEFEKYLSLKNYGSAKKTWFFRLDFRSGAMAARYLFFFGSPSAALRNQSDVTLHISREEPPGSFFYRRLDEISAPNVPSIVEVGYKQSAEAFVLRMNSNQVREEKVDSVCRKFVQDVVDRHFG